MVAPAVIPRLQRRPHRRPQHRPPHAAAAPGRTGRRTNHTLMLAARLLSGTLELVLWNADIGAGDARLRRVPCRAVPCRALRRAGSASWYQRTHRLFVGSHVASSVSYCCRILGQVKACSKRCRAAMRKARSTDSSTSRASNAAAQLSTPSK